MPRSRALRSTDAPSSGGGGVPYACDRLMHPRPMVETLKGPRVRGVTNFRGYQGWWLVVGGSWDLGFGCGIPESGLALTDPGAENTDSLGWTRLGIRTTLGPQTDISGG